MMVSELLERLKRLKVETKSLACMGCGYEHNCGIHGCRIIREAVQVIEELEGKWEERVEKYRELARYLREIESQRKNVLLKEAAQAIECLVKELEICRAEREALYNFAKNHPREERET